MIKSPRESVGENINSHHFSRRAVVSSEWDVFLTFRHSGKKVWQIRTQKC